MEPSTAGRQNVCFGIFEVDLAAGELRKRGRRIKLQEQPFHVLALLLQRPGETVTREELQQEVWPSDTFVEFDHGLNTAIKKIRQALGDSPTNPRFIETLPRRGYRFIAPVNGSEAPAPARRWSPARIVALLAVAGIAGTLAWLFSRTPTTSARPLTATAITTFPGWEKQPSFSPDGTQVAFTWHGESRDNVDIYVKVIGVETPLRLTTHPASDSSPAWSPDGRFIAFARLLPDGTGGVFLIPPVGGPERKVAEARIPDLKWVPDLAWSPYGKWLVVADKSSSDEPFALFSLSLETGEKRRLTNPPPGTWGDDGPSFSPDGRTLAFSRFLTSAVGDLYLLSLSEDLSPKDEPRRLTFENRWAAGPVWTPDGREIVFSFPFRHLPSLYTMAPSGAGKPQLLASLGEGAYSPTISRNGSRLAYTLGCGDINVWRVQLSAQDGQPGLPAKLISSTRLDHLPSYSPDGKRIAFVSNRAGTPEIWVCDSDGRNCVQLTSFGDREVEWPRWSPNGRRIVFAAYVEGQSEIFVIDPQGGMPRRLTEHPADDRGPSWSHDGRWIYFGSNRTGEKQVWKMPAEGGEPLQVTEKGGGVSFASPDGRFLFYSKGTSLWRLLVAGGEEQRVLESVLNLNFAVTNDGIYFISQPAPKADPAIQFLSFATGKTTKIADIQQPLAYGFSVSPDARSILYTQLDTIYGDLMLAENFR